MPIYLLSLSLAFWTWFYLLFMFIFNIMSAYDIIMSIWSKHTLAFHSDIENKQKAMTLTNAHRTTNTKHFFKHKREHLFYFFCSIQNKNRFISSYICIYHSIHHASAYAMHYTYAFPIYISYFDVNVTLTISHHMVNQNETR